MAGMERIKDNMCDISESVVYFSANRVFAQATSPPTRIMALKSSLSVSIKGGERTDEDDSDTSLVHSQLQVRGGVSPGQYHSTVMAT